MAVFWVHRKDANPAWERVGTIVIADTWQQAKGIVLADWDDPLINKKEILVEEVSIDSKGIIGGCDWVSKDRLKQPNLDSSEWLILMEK